MEGVYERFRVTAGLHAELGEGGNIKLKVVGSSGDMEVEGKGVAGAMVPHRLREAAYFPLTDLVLIRPLQF